MRRFALPFALSCGFALAACAEERVNPNPQPDVRTDTGADTGTAEDATVTDSGTGPEDSGTPPRDAGDAGPLCTPNNDGVIERAEMPYALGAQVLYVVNDDNTTVDGINTAPRDTPSGPEWDFSAMRAGDRRVLDEVQSPMGKWWQPLYPSATFALPIDRAASLFALYRSGSNALEILATVSRDMARTNILFNPAVDAIRFPLREGSSWTVTSTGNGFLNGIANSTVNTWRFTVDRRGTALTPATRFPVLRLRMDLDQTVTGTVIRRTQRTYLFLSECWGLVARVASVDNEMSMEFTRASEYRRLGL
ncbi:MAG: hypothetical protein JNK05_27730 [Myxococcales bacterium]|nr:hypothetical protein [Myxococcales bacterium]